MPHIGPGELLVILVLALVIFGPGKLPQLGRAVGQSFREFKESLNAGRQEAASEEKQHKPQSS